MCSYFAILLARTPPRPYPLLQRRATATGSHSQELTATRSQGTCGGVFTVRVAEFRSPNVHYRVSASFKHLVLDLISSERDATMGAVAYVELVAIALHDNPHLPSGNHEVRLNALNIFPLRNFVLRLQTLRELLVAKMRPKHGRFHH